MSDIPTGAVSTKTESHPEHGEPYQMNPFQTKKMPFLW